MLVAGRVGDEQHIYSVPIKGEGSVEPVVRNVKNVTALALDTDNRKIYWNSHQRLVVIKFKLRGG